MPNAGQSSRSAAGPSRESVTPIVMPEEQVEEGGYRSSMVPCPRRGVRPLRSSCQGRAYVRQREHRQKPLKGVTGMRFKGRRTVVGIAAVVITGLILGPVPMRVAWSAAAPIKLGVVCTLTPPRGYRQRQLVTNSPV